MVVFPSLLGEAVVSTLRGCAMAATADAVTVDRTANIRDPSNRTLRAVAVADAAAALGAIGETLGPFLRHALVDAEVLVLEVSRLRTRVA